MVTETIRVQLNYPKEQVQEPILYRLVTKYGLVPNIRRANIDARTGGFIFLELTGKKDELEKAIYWLEKIGIQVSAIGLDGTEEWVV